MQEKVLSENYPQKGKWTIMEKDKYIKTEKGHTEKPQKKSCKIKFYGNKKCKIKFTIRL